MIAPVMEGWWRTELIPENTLKIREIIAEFKPDIVSIFSFAIHTEKDRAAFNMGTLPMIENSLGIQIQGVPVVEGEIIQACCKIKKISAERCDFIDIRDFWGKQDSFKLWCQHQFGNAWKNWNQSTEVMFLDDDVFNEDFSWPDLQISGKIIDITKC